MLREAADWWRCFEKTLNDPPAHIRAALSQPAPAPAPQPADDLRAAAERALAVFRKGMEGTVLSQDEKALSDRIVLAACFAAEAYSQAGMDEFGIYGLHQSFLRALVDPLDPALDYLRDDPTEGPKALAALSQNGGAA